MRARGRNELKVGPRLAESARAGEELRSSGCSVYARDSRVAGMEVDVKAPAVPTSYERAKPRSCLLPGTS